MNPNPLKRSRSGRFVVIAIVLLGLVLALVAKRYRPDRPVSKSSSSYTIPSATDPE